MANDDGMQARARLAGFLFLAVNVVYVVSLVTSTNGPQVLHRPAVALQVIASAATIAMAWSFYQLLKPVDQGLALMALLFRVAEATLFGVLAVFSLLLLDTETGGLPGPDAAALAWARQAQFASAQVGSIYFCGGSAIFFHLLHRSRFIPSAVAAFGLIATLVSLASALAEIGAPEVARYLAFSGALLLLAELTAGVALLVAGARRAPTVV